MSKFIKNTGSVFNITNTDVILDGSLHFAKNKGGSGAVFRLQGASIIHLCNGLRAEFIRNVALLQGGVIYDYNPLCLEMNQCSCLLQATDSKLNVSMLFINNTARSGNAIISTNIIDCFMQFDQQTYNSSKAKWYLDAISNGTLGHALDLSAIPSRLCKCSQGHCNSHNEKIMVYPGVMVHIPIAAVDGFGQNTYGEVNLRIYDLKKTYGIPIILWNISTMKETLLPQESCTIIKVAFYKRGDMKNPSAPFLSFEDNFYHDTSTVSVDLHRIKYQLYLKDCPVGFQFDSHIGICKCSPVLNKLDYIPSCKITFYVSQNSFPVISISKPSNFITVWIGLISNGTNNSYFGVSSSCPIYCSFNPKYKTFVVNGSEVILANSSNISDRINICIDNREGPLCSQCITGYSSVFGSSECKQCSNWWLLTLIVYAVAGPLLVYLLYALKLTLTTGTINGFIFYAQIFAVIKNPGQRYSHLFNLFQIVKSLVALFNLSFYYPLCFYDGMSELMKSGIGLAFPFYLLIIVVGLIIASRYSVKLSNRLSHSSVQVLVTIVHLSFSRLLTSVLITFSSVEIHTNTTETPLLVWEYDATIEYGKGGHLILVIITSVMVGPLLCVYLIVLLSGRLLLKINMLREYLRPVYEAIHAPYKTNREFFFPTQVLLVLFFYIFYSQERSFTILYAALTVTIFYTIISAYVRPFKLTSLNFLNVFLLFIILLGFVSDWYLLQFEETEALAIVGSSASLLVLFLFIINIICHILWVRGLQKKALSLKIFALGIINSSRSAVRSHKMRSEEGSFFESCPDVREPLLSPVH